MLALLSGFLPIHYNWNHATFGVGGGGMKIYPDLMGVFPKPVLEYRHFRIMEKSPSLPSQCSTSIKGFGRIHSATFSDSPYL
jgi:hypothetical protein